MITVRIDPNLLAALKRKASRDGRTVSAEVVNLVRGAVESTAGSSGSIRSMGMFADFEAPDLNEMVSLRREQSRRLRRSRPRKTRG